MTSIERRGRAPLFTTTRRFVTAISVAALRQYARVTMRAAMMSNRTRLERICPGRCLDCLETKQSPRGARRPPPRAGRQQYTAKPSPSSAGASGRGRPRHYPNFVRCSSRSSSNHQAQPQSKLAGNRRTCRVSKQWKRDCKFTQVLVLCALMLFVSAPYLLVLAAPTRCARFFQLEKAPCSISMRDDGRIVGLRTDVGGMKLLEEFCEVFPQVTPFQRELYGSFKEAERRCRGAYPET